LPVRSLRSAAAGGRSVGWRGLAGRRAIAGGSWLGGTRRLFARPVTPGRRHRRRARTAWLRLWGRPATGRRLPISTGRAAAGRPGVASRLFAWPAPGSRRLRH